MQSHLVVLTQRVGGTSGVFKTRFISRLLDSIPTDASLDTMWSRNGKALRQLHSIVRIDCSTLCCVEHIDLRKDRVGRADPGRDHWVDLS